MPATKPALAILATVALGLGGCTPASDPAASSSTATDATAPRVHGVFVVPAEFTYPEAAESVQATAVTTIHRTSYRIGPLPPERLVEMARLALRGRISGVSASRFNSDDGRPFDVADHSTADGRMIAREVWHEVRLEVTEVLGDAAQTGVSRGDFVVYKEPGGLVAYTDAGGRHVAYEAEGQTKYQVGDEVIVLLDWERMAQIRDGRPMERYELMVIDVGQYMFIINQDTAVSADVRYHDEDAYPGVEPAQLPIRELKDLVQKYLGTDAGEVPTPGWHDPPPHPPVDDHGEPYVPPPDTPPHTHGEDE